METSKDSLPPSPSKEEIAACIDNHFGGPTTSHFHPDFGSSIKSPWNKKIVSVFLASFKKIQEVKQKDDAATMREFAMHFQHLRTKYKRQLDSTPKAGEWRNARRVQKHTLHGYCKKGCHRFEQLDHLHGMLDVLGSEGMSKDESDHESRAQTGNRS